MFLCTGNSCRSQMAEGFARELGIGLIEAHSAGISPQGVNLLAVAVMQEIGIEQKSGSLLRRHAMADRTDLIGLHTGQ